MSPSNPGRDKGLTIDETVRRRRWDKTISLAIGEELRRTRQARGWSRAQLVAQLPSGIGDRTLLSYEHGTRHPTAVRLIELCHALRIDTPTLLARALQRARIHIETLPLMVDLHALLRDGSDTFRSIVQWARNTLNEHPDGVVEVEPLVVRNLALFMGCAHEQLARYLARFVVEEEAETTPATPGRATRP